MKEIWKDIDDDSGYQISNHGRVRSRINNSYSWRTQEELKKQKPKWEMEEIYIHSTGYQRVRLGIGAKSIHQLVWDTFGDRPRNGLKLLVDHIDENKLNNRIDNLQLLTPRENTTKHFKTVKTTSKYVGVSFQKNGWVAQIHMDGKMTYIGRYKTEEEASEAYQKVLAHL